MADPTGSGDIPPATPPAPSPAAPATPPQPTPPAQVITLSKEDHDKLQRQAAQASTAQHDKDVLQNKLDAMSRRKVAPLPPLEAQAVATVKSQVASAVIANPKYAPLLQKNPLLAKVLAKNPLGLLDKDEFLDEEDATNQVLDFLDAEIVKLGDPAAPAAPNPAPAAPAPKEANPGGDSEPTATPTEKAKKEAEEARAKLPPQKRIEQSIESRLAIK